MARGYLFIDPLLEDFVVIERTLLTKFCFDWFAWGAGVRRRLRGGTAEPSSEPSRTLLLLDT